MAKWRPCKRSDFIKKLVNLGFDPPELGGRHSYMRYRSYTLTLPSNKEYSVPQLRMLLHEIEEGIRRKISLDEWESLLR
jgi:hypothetical protein